MVTEKVMVKAMGLVSVRHSLQQVEKLQGKPAIPQTPTA
jgi:hypothetical protein